MFAIDESTSSDCAREMRGTASIASAVTPRAASACTRSGFSAGASSDTTTCPGRSRAISDSDGALIFSRTSAFHTASSMTSAPARRYAASSKLDSAPASRSTNTAYPSPRIASTVFGVAATLVSPGRVSLGTPMRTGVSSRPAGVPRTYRVDPARTHRGGPAGRVPRARRSGSASGAPEPAALGGTLVVEPHVRLRRVVVRVSRNAVRHRLAVGLHRVVERLGAVVQRRRGTDPEAAVAQLVEARDPAARGCRAPGRVALGRRALVRGRGAGRGP